MASALASPASPRLPSPPPIPEDQLSPVPASPEQQKFFSNLDHAANRRIRPGTKAVDMAEGPPLVELSEIDSAFQLTEHLKALHNFLTHPVGSNSTIPVDRYMAIKLAQSPDNIDKTLWLYELCRFLTQKVNSIIVALFSDSPPCSSTTCPEMRASEWQYLCAVHDPPKSCCAIDYCCHTLDWAANTLTSPKHFPSRLALGTDQSTQHSQMRQLTNIFRRVYRIFAHAWFQHRDMFWKVEGRTGLYIFFKMVCDVYGLIPEDNYTIPVEAEGVEPPSESKSSMPPLILKREPSDPGPQDTDNSTVIEGFSDHTLSTAGTTKRHRHSPSVGATAVHTVVEENEEEEEQPKDQSRPLTQIFESTTEDGDVTAIEDLQGAKDGSGAAEEPTSVAPETTSATLQSGKEQKNKATKAEVEPIAKDQQSSKVTTGKEASDASKAEEPTTEPLEAALEPASQAAGQEEEKKVKKAEGAAESAEPTAAAEK